MEDVLLLHAVELAVRFDEAQHHILSLQNLESALTRPQNAAFYENADLPRQAAHLLWGVISDHPFIDGNKRTAWITTQYFLNLNGFLLGRDYDEAFETVRDIAKGLLGVDEVDTWIRENLVAIEQLPLPGMTFPARPRRNR